MPDRPVEFITVPAGTKESRGRAAACRAPIYWVERPKMRKGQPVPGQTARSPVDCAVLGGQEPDSLSSGRGVSHFTTCEAADEF